MSAQWKEKPPMAEDNSSGSSSSPTPGDTLPWNLPKHQRTKRTKAAAGGNGSVLDPAERAVLRIAEELPLWPGTEDLAVPRFSAALRSGGSPPELESWLKAKRGRCYPIGPMVR
ncbi:hypothetical protein E2320_011826 [Naja naja]|nr:hypothetical protein E2320_011826 [Naja naja]